MILPNSAFIAVAIFNLGRALRDGARSEVRMSPHKEEDGPGIDDIAPASAPGDGEDITADIVRRMINESADSALFERELSAVPAPDPDPVAPDLDLHQILAETQADPDFSGYSEYTETLLDTGYDIDPAERFASEVLPADEIQASEPIAVPPWWKPLVQKAWGDLVAFLKRPEAAREFATALLAVYTILFPGYVALYLVLAILSAVIAWLTLGPDRASELVVNWHARLAQRDPERAEMLRLRAARVSATITRWVDQLPDSWTTGFTLPDFEPTGAVPEKLKDDPFEKLAAQVHRDGAAQS